MTKHNLIKTGLAFIFLILFFNGYSMNNIINPGTFSTGDTITRSGSAPGALSGGTISIGSGSVIRGNSPGTFVGSRAASGGTGDYTYQWQQSADDINWSDIPGATGQTYTAPSLDSTTFFRRITKSGSLTAPSNTIEIAVSASKD